MTFLVVIGSAFPVIQQAAYPETRLECWTLDELMYSYYYYCYYKVLFKYSNFSLHIWLKTKSLGTHASNGFASEIINCRVPLMIQTFQRSI